MKPQRHTNPPISSPSTPPRAAPESEQPEPNTPNFLRHERIPPQWSWHYRTLRHLRDRLLRAHAEHSSQAAAPADMLAVDVADTAQEQSARDLLWAELGNEGDQLFEVDCALQRIREGTYGFCEETGHPIPANRLRAIPWTRYSLAAAQPIEQRALNVKKYRL